MLIHARGMVATSKHNRVNFAQGSCLLRDRELWMKQTLYSMQRFFILFIASVAGLLAGCDDARTTETKDRLVGTWIAESKSESGTTQRTLTIQPDGRVKEATRIAVPGGETKDELMEGEWSYDGANFKRKYTYIDGKPLTNANFIYVTYELRSVTETELVGESNVGHGKIRFQRMAGKSI